MNFENFAYWLQGFFEMTDTQNLSPNQVLMIKEHLKLVFEKKTPQINPNVPFAPKTPPYKWHDGDVICTTDTTNIKGMPETESTCAILNAPDKEVSIRQLNQELVTHMKNICKLDNEPKRFC